MPFIRPTVESIGGAGSVSSAIVFPSNGDNSVSDVVFRLIGGSVPDIAPLTLLWKIAPLQQAGFYSTFFHARTDGVLIGDNKYFGCHPYPQGGSSGTTHNWEVSFDGFDDIVDENSNSTIVTKGTVGSPVWYSQAAVAQNIAGDGDVDFWWDLRASANRRINHRINGAPLVNGSPDPALSFGDAPWQPNVERASCILRGIQIYPAALTITLVQALEVLESDAAVLAYCSANGLTPWYVNMNPTPSDVSDKSGNGRNPTWLSADRPALWTP